MENDTEIKMISSYQTCVFTLSNTREIQTHWIFEVQLVILAIVSTKS